MNCKKIITGIKNYDIDELKSILDTYVYNKNDNNYNGIPVYKIIDIPKLPKEEFKKYPQNVNIAYKIFKEYLQSTDTEIEVSNFGRVKIDGIIQKQDEIKYGYLFINLNKRHYNVYRLVGETWCPCPVKDTNFYWQVHHITNNGYDNRSDNLIWVNLSEHNFIESSYNAKEHINNIKESLFIRLDNVTNLNTDKENLTEIFKDIVLIGTINDKKRIEQYIHKINIDLSDMKYILLKNIGIEL